jgi:hypothetical protein
MRMRNPLWAYLAVIAATAAPAAQQGARGGEWPRHSGDSGSTKYAALDQISKDNVSQLRIAWRRPAVDAGLVANLDTFAFSSDFRATPLMIDGVLFDEPSARERSIVPAALIVGFRWLTAPEWRQYVQEEHYEKHWTESIAYGGGSDSCGDLRPAQAGKPDDRYRHHQG